MIEHDFNLDCKILISMIKFQFGLENLSLANKTLVWIGPSQSPFLSVSLKSPIFYHPDVFQKKSITV